MANVDEMLETKVQRKITEYYQKPTSKNRLLNYNSEHPQIQKTSTITRIRTPKSKKKQFQKTEQSGGKLKNRMKKHIKIQIQNTQLISTMLKLLQL